jgi:tetratricopeptide (TPR) repeat protein
MGAVALGFAEVGQNDRAIELARRALALERPSEFAVEEQAIEEFEAEAASVLAFAGDIDQARSTIDPIRDQSIRTRALNEIAAAELKQGAADRKDINDIRPRFDMPLEVSPDARRSGWARQEAQEMLNQSRSFLSSGNNDKAIETAIQALEAARGSYAQWLNGRERTTRSNVLRRRLRVQAIRNRRSRFIGVCASSKRA